MYMRLGISKSKNTTNFYIIKDYKKNGKRSTKMVKKIGNIEEVKVLAGNQDYKEWLNNYVKKYNEKYCKKDIIVMQKNNRKVISSNINSRYNIGYLFLQKIYNQLNIKEICNTIAQKYKFEFDLNEILSYLVFARVIYPSSKLETFKQCKNFIMNPKFKLHDEYRSLNYIAENMDYIQKQIFDNSTQFLERNSRIIYYDCTNYFFEINTEDDLRRYGVSKEHRPNPIVSMGLFMDGDGLPLSFNIYPGNRSEKETLIPEESKIVNSFKLSDTKIILCTDAGLSSDDIKKYNINNGRGFVITQSLKKFKKEYQEQVFNKKDWRLSGDLTNVYDLEKIANDPTLKEQYYNNIFYKIVQTETKSVKQDTIVSFSFKYYDYNQNIRNGQIERAKKNIETENISRKNRNQNDPNRFVSEINTTKNGDVADEKNYSINQQLIDEESKYDGLYAVSTNIVGNVEEILKITKGRWEIEESFRIMKSDFLARPINLSREDRIKAHFMTCFISLLIYRILEKKLNYKYSTKEILDTLRNMEMYESKGDGYIPIYTRTNITDDLHENFDFRTDYEIVTYKDFEKIFKAIG